MLPIRMILRHPIATYRDYRRFGTTYPADVIIKLSKTLFENQADDTLIKRETELKATMKHSYLKDVRKTIGRQLTVDEMKFCSCIYDITWPLTRANLLANEINNPIVREITKEILIYNFIECHMNDELPDVDPAGEEVGCVN